MRNLAWFGLLEQIDFEQFDWSEFAWPCCNLFVFVNKNNIRIGDLSEHNFFRGYSLGRNGVQAGFQSDIGIRKTPVLPWVRKGPRPEFFLFLIDIFLRRGNGDMRTFNISQVLEHIGLVEESQICQFEHIKLGIAVV